MEMFKEKKALAIAKCRNVTLCAMSITNRLVWSGLSTFEMKVFKYSEGSSNVSITSNMIG